MTLSEHVWHDKDLSLQKPSIGLDFAALRQQWCRLCITGIYSKETKSNIKTNKQTFLSFEVFYKRSMPAAKPEYTYYSMFVDARFEKVCHND